MIKSFRHNGLEKFFLTGSKSGIQPQHAGKLNLMLTALEHATKPRDLDATAWRLHRLSGDLAGYYSISVSGNWCLIFRFERIDAVDVDYIDYH